jgi:predicted flap endonuclease-1-like 5' DNA nuclease
MQRSLILLLAICLLLSACQSPAGNAPAATEVAPAANSPKTPQALQPTPGKGVLFQVIKPDGSSTGFTWDDLKKLPLANLTVEGKVEEGPKLIDVLKAAGVTDFSEISLSGSASPVTLTKAQVDDNTILDFNNHGTVKLASIYIPKPQWTKDVSEIKVK